MTDDDAFSPLDSPSTMLSDAVYNALGSAILDGRLKAGERLRDGQLAQRLGVSRTPVREALQRLERIGLVEVSAGRWTRVSTPDEAAVDDTHEFAAYLMGNATRMAVRRAPDDTLALLLHHLDAMVEASARDDLPAMYEARVTFFTAAIIASDNMALRVLTQEVEFLFRRNLSGRDPQISDAGVRRGLYAALRDAIAARDGDGAERAVRALHGVA